MSMFNQASSAPRVSDSDNLKAEKTMLMSFFSLVSMPELIAQTNMDHQAVNRLREELAKITQWLGKNVTRYFTTEYEAATQEYIEKARGVA